MIQQVVLLGILAVAAYKDYKEKSVYLCGMLLAGIAGILLHLLFQTPTLPDMLAGAGIGVIVIAAALLTGESIGIGDGVVFLVSGIFLGFRQNLELFLTALFLAGGVALFLLVVKRKRRTYQLPFLPFVAVAYLIQLL